MSEYYVAYCALNLNNADGTQLISSFVKKYPNHPKAAKAYYSLGVSAFDAADYITANHYLKIANLSTLSVTEKSEKNFKIAYSAFSLNKKEESIKYFDIAKRQQGEYFADANYYAGYLAYIGGDYDKSLIDLKKAGESPKYQNRVPIMVASGYHKQKRYGELLTYTTNYQDIETESRRIGLSHQIYQLAGEAAYEEAAYEEALTYFGLYRQLAERSITEPTLYRIAFANYSLGNVELAIEDFKRVALKDDTLSQYASYYLGQLYVDQNNYLFATNAFDKASKLEFNKEIQEESAFNVAKVNFEAKKYSQAIVALDRFVKKYPTSSYVVEANNLLSEAFLNTNDFTRAIAFIERIENKSDRIKEAYQKVTFYKGTEYFNSAKYKTAIQLFDKSLLYEIDKDLVIASYFWKAEAFRNA